jgi:hypothetical protein
MKSTKYSTAQQPSREEVLTSLALSPEYQREARRFTLKSGFGEVAAYADSIGLEWAAFVMAVMYRGREATV